MPRTRKIAMVGREWDRFYARLFTGGLQYASGHPSLKVVIRSFTKTVAANKLAASIEHWGAEGIYGGLLDDELQGLRSALRHPIPIVNNFNSAESPGVVRVLGDAHVAVEMGVTHLRHLGLKSFGLLFTDPPPERDRVLPSFKELTEPHGSALTLPIPEDQLLNPERNTQAVPARLATWLRELPKPCGVLCPCVGSGRYLVECCGQLGLHVPREIAIIGSDDADVCLNCTPTLTSITPNVEMVGSESVRILLGIADGVKPSTPTIRLKGLDLIVRESTGLQPSWTCDVAGALEYIKANATKGLSVAQLLRETRQPSQPKFYQLFHEATGKTPALAIRDRQLEEVRRLLATTQLPAASVSGMAGFSSPSVMARLFRKVEGMTPMEYRKRRNKA
jgi:LacI family transcriptional regulator